MQLRNTIFLSTSIYSKKKKKKKNLREERFLIIESSLTQ